MTDIFDDVVAFADANNWTVQARHPRLLVLKQKRGRTSYFTQVMLLLDGNFSQAIVFNRTALWDSHVVIFKDQRDLYAHLVVPT